MNAIIQPKDDVEVINHLPLDMVHPDPNQPRNIFDEERLNELAISIKANGVMQPIIVRVGDDNQVIIKDGERRHRASQLAGMETIPTIMATGERKPIDILIDQVCANQHDELKALEMGAFFEQLVTVHLVRVKDIPGLLEKRGLKSMSREYISNMRRLIGLPDWAKDMINKGTITPSHGKHILTAGGNETVLNQLRNEIESHIEDYGGAPTVSELEDEIEWVFRQNYRDINIIYSYDGDIPKFDISTCSDCKTCKTFKMQYGRERTYCMDEPCYNEKQGNAIVAEAAKKKNTELKAAKQAEKTGKAPPQSAGSLALAKGRIEKTQEYLDTWLRTQLTEHLPDDEANCYNILLWIATGSHGDWRVQTPELELTNARELGINLTLKSDNIRHEGLLTEVVTTAVASMSRGNLRHLAHHCEISLKRHNYQIDIEYLTIKSKQELIDTIPEVVQDSFEDWGKETKKPRGMLADQIFNHGLQYGIPEDLAEYYEESKS